MVAFGTTLTLMNKPERIPLEKGSDAWLCLCGNHANRSGFEACDTTGYVTEPDEEHHWPGLYICIECGRIIDQNRTVVRRVSEEELEAIVTDLLAYIDADRERPMAKSVLDILEPYLPWLEELTREMNKRYGDGTDFMSVERILEETISEWIYDARKFMDMAGPLPVVYMNGKRYYRDDRLREFRNVDDFNDCIKFEQFKF
jgi:hypothetical protein